jgi:phage/plasmid-associated DNA primase
MFVNLFGKTRLQLSSVHVTEAVRDCKTASEIQSHLTKRTCINFTDENLSCRTGQFEVLNCFLWISEVLNFVI